MNRTFRFLMSVGLLFMGAVSQAGTFDDWSHRMTVTVSGYNQAGTLTNFPVLVVLSNNVGGSGFTYDDFVSPTGGDLRFAASNMVDELALEIEKWDTNGASLVWVRIPQLDGPAAAVYAFWGSTNTTLPSGSVWDTNYVGVWHMAQTNTPDATTNARNGTVIGTVTPVAGLVDGACDFDANNDCVQVADSPAFTLGSRYTVSAWIKSDPMAAYEGFVGTYNNNGFIFALDNTANNLLGFWAAGTWRWSSTSIADGPWRHVVYTANGTDARFYVDGKQVGTAAGVAINDGGVLQIGAAGTSWTGYRFDGSVDEVRLSSAPRGSNWVWASWMNQASNTTFLSYAEAGPVSTALAVDAFPPQNVGAWSATVSGRVRQTGEAENPDVFLCVGHADGGTNGGTSAWARVDFLGAAWGRGESFTMNLAGLLSGSNYAYRFYATNSTGEAWSPEAPAFTTVSLPVITNLGALAQAGTALLRGEVLETGAQAPQVWFDWWAAGGSVTSRVYAGIQSGSFSTALSGLEPQSDYAYRVSASNAAGVVQSGAEPFETMGALFVALGGNDSAGSSWATAYTNLQTAVNAAGEGAVIYVKADVFGRTNQIDLSGKVNLDIRGGYAGATPEPGALAEGPSVFRRTAGETRLFYGTAATVTLSRIWIEGGNFSSTAPAPAYGAGLSFLSGSILTLQGCTVTNNAAAVLGTQEGGGVYISGGRLTATDCAFVNNRLPKSGWQTVSRGGAIGANGADVAVSNSLFRNNYVHSRHNNAFGGAIYANGGTLEVTGCAFVTNSAQGDTYDTGDNGQDYGGAILISGAKRFRVDGSYFGGNYCVGRGSTRRGDVLYVQGGTTGSVTDCAMVLNGYNSAYGGEAQVYIAGGAVGLTNVLAARGVRGSAIQVNGTAASSVLDFCTLVSNALYGATRTAGALSVRNAIAWGNGSGGISSPDSIVYSISQEILSGTGNTVEDPLFADTQHYHLQARAGAYTNGFFGGGTWVQSAADSPALDAADPAASCAREPHPNGFRAEKGAYGNAPTASKTYLEDPGVFTVLTAFAHPATPLDQTSALLRGQVLSAGGAEAPEAVLCWGPADGGTVSTGGWAFARAVGARAEWELFEQVADNLAGGATYHCRAYVTNSLGEDWSAVVTFSPQSVALVSNRGPYRVRRTVAELRGQVLSDGGDAPFIWFRHWQDGSAVTTVVAVGQTPAPLPVSTALSNLAPNTFYHYVLVASNAVGVSTSAAADYWTLDTTPIDRYVTPEGAGLLDGTSWANAYVGIDNALEDCTWPGDVIHVRHGSYVRNTPVNVGNLPGVTIRGGYAGEGEPGDLTNAPTVFTRAVDKYIRIFQGNATTVTLERVTVAGGYLSTADASGAGLFFSGGSSITLSNTVVRHNTSAAAGQAGVGLYITGGVLRVVDSVFATNMAPRVDSGAGGRGGGIGAAGTAVSLERVRFVGNELYNRHSGSHGGALYLSGGEAVVADCRFESNFASNEGNSDSPGPARGGAIAALKVAPLRIENCLFTTNKAWTSNGSPIGGSRQGGVLYLLNSTAQVSRCVMTRNGHWTDPYGVVYAEGGSVGLSNVLAAYGQSGNGFYIQSGMAGIGLCTVVSNTGWGVRGGGTTVVHNAIAWGNSTGGVTNASATYTLSQESQEGDGNFAGDPLFTDGAFFHLQSRSGAYAGGYFSGGDWAKNAGHSPAIDAGDPATPYALEPPAAGRRVNLGAYGNTEVASKSFAPGTLIILW